MNSLTNQTENLTRYSNDFEKKKRGFKKEEKKTNL